jgi:hypothetical protein
MSIVKLPSSSSELAITTNDKESPVPIIYFDKIVLDTHGKDGIATSVQMHVEIPLDDGVYGIPDDEVNRYLNILLVRSSSRSVSESIEKSSFLSSPGTPFSTAVYNNSLFNISDSGPESFLGSNEIVQTSTGKRIMYIYFEVRDFPESQEHLDYYAQCSLDVDKLASSMGVTTDSLSDFMSMSGPLSGERVLSGGTVNMTSYIYQVTSTFPEGVAGTFWSGPVIEDANGNYKSAEWWFPTGKTMEKKPTVPTLDLQRIQTRNSKIQDFRIINKMSSYDLTLTPDSIMPITIKGSSTYNNSIQHPDAYTSNAFLSRDMEGNCRFMFEFDYDKFITKESKFGKMLTNPFIPASSKQKIYYHSRITQLQIIRRQVETAMGYNRLGSPLVGIYRSELDPEIKIVAQTASDPESGNSLRTTSIYNPGTPCARGTFLDITSTDEGGNPSTLVGTVGEIFKIKNSPKTTKTIMVTDNSSKCLTDGSFQYGVRIEMEDGTVRFLNERLKNLQTVRDYLVGYNNIVQTPKPSFDIGSKTGRQIKTVEEYYTQLFDNLSDSIAVTAANRINDLALTIERLRFEQGYPVGQLGAMDIILFPWVVAPSYLVDTMETISDFGYKPPTNIATTTTTFNSLGAINNLNSPNPNKQAASTQNAFSQKGTISKGTSKGSLMTGASPISKSSNLFENMPSSEGEFIDLFDEDSAYYAIESLLNPQIATSESILNVIGMLDILIQKMRIMLGSSLEESLPNTGLKSKIAKNSKISVLNLEDYFVELYNAKLSKMPSVDYMGFANSPGRVASFHPPAGTKNEMAPNTNTQQRKYSGKNSIKSSESVAGFFQTDTSQVRTRFRDEDVMYEAAYVEELTTPEESQTDGSAEEEAARKKAEIVRERKQKQKEIYQSVKEERRQESQDLFAGRPEPAVEESVQLSAAIIYDGESKVISRTEDLVETWKDAEYVDMQNIVVAKSTGEYEGNSQSEPADTVNFLANKFGIEVKELKTPMAVQENLQQGAQRMTQDTVKASDYLGKDSNNRFGKDNSVENNDCLPGQGSSPEDLARCSNQAAARPIIQTLINLVATNGSLNTAHKQARGMPTTSPKMFSNKKKRTPTSSGPSTPRQFRNFPSAGAKKMSGSNTAAKKLTSGPTNTFGATVNSVLDAPYKSPMFKLSLDLLADLWIFEGYETDTDGNIMIKKPIWTKTNPGTLATTLEDLGREDTTEYEAVLCALRKTEDPSNGIGLNSGLEFVEANTYFLISKEGARLFDLSDVLEDLVIQYPKPPAPLTVGPVAPKLGAPKNAYGAPAIIQNSIPAGKGKF